MPGLVVDDFLRNFHTQTHQIADQSDNEFSESDEDLEAADYVDDKCDDSRNREDNAMEGDADPHEGIVSDWDLLTEKFIVKAGELGNFGHSLSHTSRLTGFFYPQASPLSQTMIWISCVHSGWRSETI